MAAFRGVPRRRFSDSTEPYIAWSSLTNHIAHTDNCSACSKYPLPPYMSIPPLLELLQLVKLKLKAAFKTLVKMQVRLADLYVISKRAQKRAFKYQLQLQKCQLIGMSTLLIKYMVALKRDAEHIQDVIYMRSHPRSPNRLWGRERERQELQLLRNVPDLTRIMMYEEDAPAEEPDQRVWIQTIKAIPLPLLYNFTRI